MQPRKIAGYGWRKDTPDHRDWLFQSKPQTIVPNHVDLSPRMPPIYDQGQLGSCTGNGIARILAYQAGQQGEPMDTPSRLFIYYEERVLEGSVNSDAGAEIRDGIKVVASKGAPPETDWPYDITRFADKPPAQAYADAVKHEALEYRRIIPGHGSMRVALANGLPIVFGFSVPASFENGSWDPATDPLPVPGPNEEIIGGHCVVLSGYDYSQHRFKVPAFQAENSWGPDWGMGGRFWMDSRWFTPSFGLADDLWVISRTN